MKVIPFDISNIENRPFINGEFITPKNGSKYKKISPIYSENLADLYICDDAEINNAVKASRISFKDGEWRNLSIKNKKTCFRNLICYIKKDIKNLSYLDCIETGRAIKNFVEDSIPKALDTLEYFSEAIDKVYDSANFQDKNHSAIIKREPIGVVGIITPWNDPLVVAMWKIAPALLTGNSVIIKPAEQSSYSLLKIASYFERAGFPKGVFNVITGTGEITGKKLALHVDVDGIFFTGSSEVGKKILIYSGQSNMKRIGLECGGKSPFIVSNRCKDLKKSAEILAKNIFYNQGQICSAPSRALLQNDISDEFIKILKCQMLNYLPKNPLDYASNVGCLISREHRKRVEGFIKRAKQEGLSIYSPEIVDEYNLVGEAVLPILIETDSSESEIVTDEVFGPVLVIQKFDSIEDAIELANNTKFGLAASIWTDDINEANLVSSQLRAGIVHINTYGEDDNSVPFGGIKESGMGKDKSIYAFDEYSYLKTIWTAYSH